MHAKSWLKLLFFFAMFITSSTSIWSENSADGNSEGHRDWVETKHLQVLINTADPSFRFVLFDGVGFVNNIFAPRPFGSYYYLNGLVFPGNTVNPNQPNYTVSKQGVPLNAANSLGDFWAAGQVIFPELNLPQVPLTPTDLELFECDFLFKPRDIERKNNLFTYGILSSGVLDPVPPVQPLLINNAAVTGGSGLNAEATGSLKALIYFQPATSSLLVDVFFDCPVLYNPHDFDAIIEQ